MTNKKEKIVDKVVEVVNKVLDKINERIKKKGGNFDCNNQEYHI